MPRTEGPLGSVSRGRVLIVLLLLAVLSGAWLAFRGVQIRDALLGARAVLPQAAAHAASGDLAALGGAQRTMSTEVGAAQGAVDDPLWRLAAAVPIAGRSFAVTRDATGVLGTVVDEVLPPLIAGGGRLGTGRLLVDGRVDLPLLDDLAEEVGKAEGAARTAQLDATRISGRFLPPPVAAARDDLLAQVAGLADGLATGKTTLGLAPAMLGAEQPRRYFLAVQNNAEVRGTGGLVGAYAVIRAAQGQLSLERVGTNRDFKTSERPVVDLGPDFSDRYDPDRAREVWSSAVLTPDWPSASRIMAGLWGAQGGGVLDGVVGVDPVSMAAVLAVTGPAQVAGRAVGVDNVVDFVMRDEYADFEDDQTRKQVLADLAGGLYEKVSAGGYEAPAMLAALGRAGGSGHLQLWSARPAEQAELLRLRVAGALSSRPGGYLHVVGNNAAGNKADYYVRRRVSYVRTRPGQGTATVELTNLVEAGAVPPIVVGRLDDPPGPVEAGQTRQLLSIYVGVGQTVRRVTVDGVEAAADIGVEQGHGVATVPVEIRRSRPTVISAEVTDPGGVLTYRQQPLVVDDSLQFGVPFVVG